MPIAKNPQSMPTKPSPAHAPTTATPPSAHTAKPPPVRRSKSKLSPPAPVPPAVAPTPAAPDSATAAKAPEPTVIAVGVDVAKAHLDMDTPTGRSRWPNTPVGVQQLLAQLPPGARLFVESTGGYERPLRDAALAAQVPIAVLNPAWVRHFAKSRGLLAKTDRLDARVLRLYGESTPCRFAEPTRPALEELSSLLSVRDQLVKTRIQLSNALEHVPSDLRAAQQALAALLRQLAERIKKLEQAARELIASEPALAQRAKALLEEFGIGHVTACALLAGLPELGAVNRGQIAALAGLAPQADDSGARTGKRHIGGGRAPVRRALYLATLTAVRQKNSVLRACYQRLVKLGKLPKVALIACARKFLLFLNSKIQKLAPLKLSSETV